MPRGQSDSTNALYWAKASAGVWSGTRRMETLATALAGMTVLAPAPMKPPGMPWTSRVGRDQVRSRTEKPGSPVSCGGADFGLAVVFFVEGQGLPGGEFGGGGGGDVVVEAGDEDAAVGVFELGDDLAEGDERVGRGAAVHAGVEVGAGAAGFNLGVDHAAQADAEGGDAGGEHFGVGDEGDVGLELVGVLADEGGDAFSADLFFAFEEDADVDGELAVVGGEEGFEGFDVHPHLAFVVDGAAGVEVAVALGGLEGRGGPLVEGLGGLDVVVAVEEDGWGGL